MFKMCFCFLLLIIFFFFCFFLLQSEREIGGRSIKMKQGLDDLGISQPTQMAKDAKLKRFTIRKECSQEKAKVLLKFLLITLKKL